MCEKLEKKTLKPGNDVEIPHYKWTETHLQPRLRKLPDQINMKK